MFIKTTIKHLKKNTNIQKILTKILNNKYKAIKCNCTYSIAMHHISKKITQMKV